MSLNERTGTRDLLYSGWHRPASIRRHVGARVASVLKLIDIDGCEACHWCNEPVALIETQKSERYPKAAPITVNLARRADVPAFSVSYEPNETCDDIAMFRLRQIWPESEEVVNLKPAKYAQWLWGLRRNHENLNPMCAAKTARLEIEDN